MADLRTERLGHLLQGSRRPEALHRIERYAAVANPRWPLLTLLLAMVGCFQTPEFEAADTRPAEVSSDVCSSESCMPVACLTDDECSNGDPCDGEERCLEGSCATGAAVVCDETGLAACQRSTCDASTGTCIVDASPDGTPCDDGLSCTAESCQAGACAPTVDGDACAIEGVCYGGEEAHPSDSCLACVPLQSRVSWTPKAQLYAGLGYLEGTSPRLKRTDTCHLVALGCHNCVKLDKPTESLNLAANAGTGVFSVPVVWREGQVRVGEPADPAPFSLQAVVEGALNSADRIVALRLTETAGSEFVSALIEDVETLKLAEASRPLLIRATGAQLESLLDVKEAFDEVPSLRPQVRYHLIVDEGQPFPEFTSGLEALADSLDAVEATLVDHPLALAKLRFARSLGLGTAAIFSVQGIERAVLMAAIRDQVDIVMVTAPQPADLARITGADSLLHVDPARQRNVDSHAVHCSMAGALTTVAVEASEPPLTAASPFDGSVALDFTHDRALPLFDVDHDADGGVILSALVELLAVGPTGDPDDYYLGIVSKAEGSSYALEIQHQFSPTVQFAARLFETYAIASHPLTSVPLDQPVWFVAAYSGDGSTYLWMDGQLALSDAPLVGGITVNDSPVTLGGDPPGGIDPPGFIDGYLHLMSLLNWTPQE